MMKLYIKTTCFFIVMGWTFLLQAKEKVNPVDQAFQKKAQDYAKNHQFFVANWWMAHLDDDLQPERIALLCGKERAAFIVEKNENQAWALSFEIDGRTQIGCISKRKNLLPSYQQRKERVVTFFQGHHRGYEKVDFAIRNHQLVIVKTESLEDRTESRKPVIKNYDQLVKNGSSYPSITETIDGPVRLESMNFTQSEKE